MMWYLLAGAVIAVVVAVVLENRWRGSQLLGDGTSSLAELVGGMVL